MIIPYEEISVNREITSQSDLNIDSRVRTSLFAWNGQFSPQFAEVMISQFAKKNDVIIDPFLGSGTTLLEAARRNIPACGIELNISAYYMSKTYEIANIPLEKRKIIIEKVSKIINSIEKVEDIIPCLNKCIDVKKDEVVSNILCTLIILLDLYNHELTLELLHKKWNDLISIINQIPFSEGRIFVDRGDTRNLKFEDDSCSFLLTSPPYINVFNYHQKYRKSVESLGFDVLKIAKCEFGANRKNRGNRFLTVIQYCIDMALSFVEVNRVCKDKSRMIYVVGKESNVLGCSFCNSKLIYEIGCEIFGFNFLLKQERVFKNRFGQNIYEDILHFENVKKSQPLERCYIIEKARDIAVRMLKDNLCLYSDNKNIDLIKEAIFKANKVNGSEVLI